MSDAKKLDFLTDAQKREALEKKGFRTSRK
jgi:hypothetical protein